MREGQMLNNDVLKAGPLFIVWTRKMYNWKYQLPWIVQSRPDIQHSGLRCRTLQNTLNNDKDLSFRVSYIWAAIFEDDHYNSV